ncbi:MAG: helix-turn-helix domain-containing protein [Candidatus Omnitrophica bacterium]|nr:helix-turn-helix domain-containing protein [Candidatus Omnitrophota bacterium]
MSKKLLTLSELADYLNLDADKIIGFVDSGVIPAYKIAGELLRFQKDQIDAIRTEIDTKVRNESPSSVEPPKIKTSRTKLKGLSGKQEEDTFFDRLSDFFYFNDFYIFSGVFILLLLVVIFRG